MIEKYQRRSGKIKGGRALYKGIDGAAGAQNVKWRDIDNGKKKWRQRRAAGAKSKHRHQKSIIANEKAISVARSSVSAYR